jgi:formylglycine-generating enzyme required for sulfatase activity
MSLGSIETQNEFAIVRYEITQAQYTAIMGHNPAFGHGEGDNYRLQCFMHDAISFVIN